MLNLLIRTWYIFIGSIQHLYLQSYLYPRIQRFRSQQIRHLDPHSYQITTLISVEHTSYIYTVFIWKFFYFWFIHSCLTKPISFLIYFKINDVHKSLMHAALQSIWKFSHEILLNERRNAEKLHLGLASWVSCQYVITTNSSWNRIA